MPRRLVSATLVGRERDLAAVVHALDSAEAGTPIHQLVAGEAGVGKTRLIDEIASIATGRGMRVLVGACAHIADGGVPYGPIVDVLRSLVGELEADEVDTLVGASRPELAHLVPALGPTVSGIHGEALQARLLDAVLGLLHRLAERAPVLFVIEDLHWADPATRETVAFLARHLRTDRILLLMTFRADELHRRHPLLPWLAEIDRSGRVERLDLARLDAAGTRALVTSILGTPPAGDLATEIHRRSDGNPFFIEELLMAGQDGPAGRLPPTLREVLLARIVALPDRAQAVIRVAAVAGRRVDHDLLARVAEMDESELIDGLRAAVSAQVLVTGSDGDGPDSDYAFRHALLQEAAYDDLLPGERQRLHRAFAVALAERGAGSGAVAAGHWAELAHHWSSARDDREAFEASVRAGEAAAGASAFVDACRHHERALELWANVEAPEELVGIDRAELLERAASAAWFAGDAHRSVALRRQAVHELESGGDPIRLGVMLERLGRALWTNGESVAALEACEQALAVMPAEPPTAERARVLSGYGQLLMLLDRSTESMALCEEAIAIARSVGARQVEGHAKNTLGLDLASLGRCGEAIASLEEAVAIAREIGNVDDLGRGYVNLGEAHLVCADVQGSAAVIRDGIAATAEAGVSRTYGRWLRENGIAVSFELGEWAEAERLSAETSAIERLGRHELRYGLSRVVMFLVARGDETADARLAELGGLLEGFPPESQFNVPWRLAEAESALWRGDPDRALEAIDKGLRETGDAEYHRYQLRIFRIGMRAAADAAEVARARRDRAAEEAAVRTGTEQRAVLEPLLASARERLVAPAADEVEAEAATIEAEWRRLRREPAAACWAEAAERWLTREKPYPLSYCRWRQAEALLQDGDRTAATAALGEAHRIATGLGARPLLAAIEGLAARSRIDLTTEEAPSTREPVAQTQDPFGLTRRERDVLPLIVRGWTNRQIAESLFISENTAGVHVSNILGKLGAATRTEAAGIAARLGLDTE